MSKIDSEKVIVWHLLDFQLDELIKLEKDIYECGVDGGMATSEAIELLHEKEKQFGVYDPSASTPRWAKEGADE